MRDARLPIPPADALVCNACSGEGSEKQNLAVEKAYEDAAAKGLRPCPTCHKMTDLKSTKVFKSSAFEPTEDELEQHSRSKRAAKRPRYSWGDDVKVRAAPQKAFEDRKLDSDSDDDMPDFPLLGSLLKKEEKVCALRCAAASPADLYLCRMSRFPRGRRVKGWLSRRESARRATTRMRWTCRRTR